MSHHDDPGDAPILSLPNELIASIASFIEPGNTRLRSRIVKPKSGGNDDSRYSGFTSRYDDDERVLQTKGRTGLLGFIRSCRQFTAAGREALYSNIEFATLGSSTRFIDWVEKTDPERRSKLTQLTKSVTYQVLPRIEDMDRAWKILSREGMSDYGSFLSRSNLSLRITYLATHCLLDWPSILDQHKDPLSTQRYYAGHAAFIRPTNYCIERLHDPAMGRHLPDQMNQFLMRVQERQDTSKITRTSVHVYNALPTSGYGCVPNQTYYVHILQPENYEEEDLEEDNIERPPVWFPLLESMMTNGAIRRTCLPTNPPPPDNSDGDENAPPPLPPPSLPPSTESSSPEDLPPPPPPSAESSRAHLGCTGEMALKKIVIHSLDSDEYDQAESGINGKFERARRRSLHRPENPIHHHWFQISSSDNSVPCPTCGEY